MASPTKFPQPEWNSSGFNPAWILRGLLLIIAIWAIFSCASSVPADSECVLIRLGKYQKTLKPGLQFKLPLGIDQLIIVPVQRQLKLEFGFSTPGGSNPSQGSREAEAEQGMVTGDLNMALVEWVVQYRIADSEKYLFQVREPGQTLRAASESVMREVIGDRTVDEVLTIGRQEIEVEALLGLKNLSERYGLGLSIMQVQLKDVHPPRGVQASFNEVNQAQQEREQAINVANGQYNKAVPQARGMADQKISEAEGYAFKRVNEAQGDADRFTAQLTEFVKAPEVTRQRLYLEAMAEVLPQMERKIILDDKAGQLLPLLSLDQKAKSK
jgi:membrane protease subunit HflK